MCDSDFGGRVSQVNNSSFELVNVSTLENQQRPLNI